MPFEKISSSTGESEAIALMKQRLSGFETKVGRLKGLSYQPKEQDVAISTTPKAGTTWMQQICHQLRVDPVDNCSSDDDKESASNDDDDDDCMNFEEISAVVPWIELAHDQGQDLEAAQYTTGRILSDSDIRFFKTHCWAQDCPNFSKTIVVIRDPCDTLVSFYRFFEDWFFAPGTVSLEAFANEFWLSRGVPASRMENASYFVHLISWYKPYMEQVNSDGKKETKILMLCFEDMKQDLEGQVRRVASFLSSSTSNDNRVRLDTPERIRGAVKRSTFEYMKKHESKFDEKLSKLSRNEACGLPPDAGLRKTKIAQGNAGTGKLQLSEELRRKVQDKWTEIVAPVTGCASYHELRQQLASIADKRD